MKRWPTSIVELSAVGGSALVRAGLADVVDDVHEIAPHEATAVTTMMSWQVGLTDASLRRLQEGAGVERVSLDALATFLAVVRSGTVTGGAQEIGLTQSTASAQIAAIERRLGYRLFDRGPRGVVLTDRGRELAARVGPPVDEALMAAAAKGPLEPSYRSVFLGGPADLLSTVVLPRVSGRLSPGTGLRVRFGEASALIDALRGGELDVVVSTIQPRLGGIAFAPLLDEEFVLVAAAHWQEAADRDIDSIPVLAYADDLPIIRRYWRSVFGRRPSRLRPTLTVPDLGVLAERASAGAGMTVVPRYIAEPLLASGRLVDLVRPEVPPLNTVYLARRRRRVDLDAETDELYSLMSSIAWS